MAWVLHFNVSEYFSKGYEMLHSVLRPSAYVLAPTNHGTMIINRFDYRQTPKGSYGVGFQLLNTQAFDPNEVKGVLELLNLRREHHGDGVVALDLGANIGVHTIEWGRHMFGWGSVISVEAQKRIFYALAGNIALNNCFNVEAICAAVGAEDGLIQFPEPNYFQPASFGSFELIESPNNEHIGQEIDWSGQNQICVPMKTINSLELDRIDLIKLDVEGMEEEALQGGYESINHHKPILIVEKIKSNKAEIENFGSSLGYKIFNFGLNFLMVHETDGCLSKITGS